MTARCWCYCSVRTTAQPGKVMALFRFCVLFSTTTIRPSSAVTWPRGSAGCMSCTLWAVFLQFCLKWMDELKGRLDGWPEVCFSDWGWPKPGPCSSYLVPVVTGHDCCHLTSSCPRLSCSYRPSSCPWPSSFPRPSSCPRSSCCPKPSWCRTNVFVESRAFWLLTAVVWAVSSLDLL